MRWQVLRFLHLQPQRRTHKAQDHVSNERATDGKTMMQRHIPVVDDVGAWAAAFSSTASRICPFARRPTSVSVWVGASLVRLRPSSLSLNSCTWSRLVPSSALKLMMIASMTSSTNASCGTRNTRNSLPPGSCMNSGSGLGKAVVLPVLVLAILQ